VRSNPPGNAAYDQRGVAFALSTRHAERDDYTRHAAADDPLLLRATDAIVKRQCTKFFGRTSFGSGCGERYIVDEESGGPYADMDQFKREFGLH